MICVHSASGRWRVRVLSSEVQSEAGMPSVPIARTAVHIPGTSIVSRNDEAVEFIEISAGRSFDLSSQSLPKLRIRSSGLLHSE
jgi:hypothetical protein